MKQSTQVDRSHAVVLGGSMAGMLAARVLSDHFRMVTIVERDHYPDGPTDRAGVPQARHVHVMLQRGLGILERLFPGVTLDLLDNGAAMLDSAADFHWLTPGGWAPRFPSGIPFLAVSRPMIDWTVRRQLFTRQNIAVREGVDITGLRTDGAQRAVTGVTIRPRATAQEELLEAALVVDATGRDSRMPDWLHAIGCGHPTETVVNSHFGYASRLYRRTPDSQAQYRATYSQAAPPRMNRLGLAFPIEGDRWMVTLAAGDADYPPTDELGFAEFARSLPNFSIWEVIRTCQPLTTIHGARSRGNRMRHYERMRLPQGLAVTGDAACAFNPVYGQGMTMAGIGAELLDDCLRRQKLEDFQRRLAREAQPAWTLATSEDYRYTTVEAPPAGIATRCMHRYLDRVIELSCHDTAVRRSLLEVFHLVSPPTVMFRPGVVAGVIRRVAHRRQSVETAPVIWGDAQTDPTAGSGARCL